MKREFEAKGSRKGLYLLLLTLVIILIPLQNQQQHAGNSPYQVAAVIVTDSSYLEGIGRLSDVMSHFMDALLEKVSFLAEIVIESSLEEQCLVGEKLDCAQLNQKGKNSSKFFNVDANSSGENGVVRAEGFDKLEFNNVNLFIDSFNKRNDDDNKTQLRACRLFNIAVDSQDLPVARMELCCATYQSCYQQCGMKKLDCDLQFRSCLGSMCKQTFDYTNETVVRQQHQLDRRQAIQRDPLETEPLLEDILDPEEEEEREFIADKGVSDGRFEEMKRGDEDRIDEHERGRREDNLNLGVEEQQGHKVKPRAARNGEQLPATTEWQVKRMKDKYKACKLATKVLIIGNLAFGCQSYKQSQWSACCITGNSDSSTM